jgi:hypothetical protein
MQQHNRMRSSERKSEAPPQTQHHRTSERHSVDQRRSVSNDNQRHEPNERERQRVNCENDLYERGSI